MKKVLLVNPHGTAQSGFSNPPLGLLYLAGSLRAAGFRTRIVDACLDGEAHAYSALDEFQPDVVGITCMTPGRHQALKIAAEAKKRNPNSTVVLGGVHPTIMYRQILENYPWVDLVVRGEGEQTFLEILREISWNSIQGVAFRADGAIIDNGVRRTIDVLDALPFPAWDLVNLARYPAREKGIYNGIDLARTPRVSVIYSRGCSGSCHFCSSWWIWKGWRCRSAKNMVDEIEWLYHEKRIRHFCFADDVLTADKCATLALCDEISRRNLRIAFHATTRSDCLDATIAEKLKGAGCYKVAIGVETASQTLLDRMGKANDVRNAEQAIRFAKMAGLQTTALMIVGNVGETETTIAESLEFLKRTQPDDIGTVGGLWILPGTRLHADCERLGYIDEKFWLGEAPYKTYTLEHSVQELAHFKRTLMKYKAASKGLAMTRPTKRYLASESMLAKWNRYVDSTVNEYSATSQWKGVDEQHKELFQEIPSHCRHILDLGCGDGWSTNALRDSGKNAVGITINPSEAEHALRRFNLHLHVQDMHDIQFPDQNFDCVYCREAFEHCVAPYIALCEMNRVLKHQGYVLINLPDTKWIREDSHFSVLTPAQMHEMFYKCRFKVVKSGRTQLGHYWYLARKMAEIGHPNPCTPPDPLSVRVPEPCTNGSSVETEPLPRIIGMLRVRNEAAWISEALASMSPLVDGFVILDDGSTDETPTICKSHPKMLHYVWQEEPETDEVRDKNRLLKWTLEHEPDWVIAMDGDEVLEDTAVGTIKEAIKKVSPAITKLGLSFLYMWDAPDSYRVDGKYHDVRHPRLFKVKGLSIDQSELAFRPSRYGANFHCGSVPTNLPGETLFLDVRVKHFGYFESIRRSTKRAFYESRDPENAARGYYDHLTEIDDIELLPYRERTKEEIPSLDIADEKALLAFKAAGNPLWQSAIFFSSWCCHNHLDIGSHQGDLLLGFDPASITSIGSSSSSRAILSDRCQRLLQGNVVEIVTKLAADGERFERITIFDLFQGFPEEDGQTLLTCLESMYSVEIILFIQSTDGSPWTIEEFRRRGYIISTVENSHQRNRHSFFACKYFTKTLTEYAQRRISQYMTMGVLQEPTIDALPADSFFNHVTRQWEGMDAESKKKATIIIPVYNQIVLTRACLESLKANTPAGLYEVIIIDNASEGDTKDHLNSSPVSARIISNKTNLGFVDACNQGAAAATTPYLVFLNNDTLPQSGWLENLIYTIEHTPKVGAVGAKLLYPDGRLQEAGGVVFRDGTSKNFGRNDDPAKPEYNRMVEVDYCSGACLLVRKDLFDSVGGFDKRYAPAYYEETDLCFALRKLGYKVIYQPQSTIIHVGSATAGTDANTGFRKFLSINRNKFRSKWENTLSCHEPPLGSNSTLYSNDRHFLGLRDTPHVINEPEPNDPRPQNPTPPQEVLYHQIQNYIAAEDYHSAITLLEESTQRFPTFALAFNDLAILYYRQGMKTKALSHYKKAVSLDPDNPNFRKNLADVLSIDKQDYEAATRHYLHALKLCPNDKEALYALGYICEQIGHETDAVDFYRKIVELDPAHHEAAKRLIHLEHQRLKHPAENENATHPEKTGFGPLRRIMFISHHLPRFDRGSADFRNHQILDQLAREGWEILYLYRSEIAEAARYMEGYRGCVTFRQLPWQTSAYERAIADFAPEIVWITSLWTIPYTEFVTSLVRGMSGHRSFRLLIDTMDFHAKKFDRKYDLNAIPEDNEKALKFRALEESLYPMADGVITVTPDEADDIRKAIPQCAPLAVVPNVHSIPDAVAPIEGRRHVCFLGNFTVNHNIDAAHHFVANILPRIHRKKPECELHLIGFASDQMADLASHQGVRLIGPVDDLAPVMDRYRVFACSMTYGAGMKGKIGMAFAHGVPVVSTSIGIEGFPVKNGRDCAISDSDEDFAQQCIRLLEDDGLCQAFQTAGRRLIYEHFSLRRLSDELHSVLAPGSLSKAMLEHANPSEGRRDEPSEIALVRNDARQLSAQLDQITSSTCLRAGAKSLFNSKKLHISWILTRRCNYDCSYCNAHDNQNGKFVSLDALRAAVDKLANIEDRQFTFGLAGGEPTIHPHYADLLEYIGKRLGEKLLRINTTTNLSLPSRYFNNLLDRLGNFRHHVQFVASYHFEFANQVKFIDNVRLLGKEGVPITVSIMAHPENMNETKHLFETLQDANSQFVRTRILAIREGFGGELDKRYNEQDVRWLRQYDKHDYDEGIILDALIDGSIRRLHLKSAADLTAYGLNRFKGMYCNAGVNHLSIDEDGYLAPAVCFRKLRSKTHNIYTDTFTFHPQPVACPFERCGCISDLRMPKFVAGFDYLPQNELLPSKETLPPIGNAPNTIKSHQHDTPSDKKILKRYDVLTVNQSSRDKAIEFLKDRLNYRKWQAKESIYMPVIDRVEKKDRIDRPTISIITISWRLDPDTIENFRRLESERHLNFELIFVSNGGHPGEFDSLNPHIDTYIRLNSNTGAYLARNIGALFANAPILFFLEDDGLPAENLIASHLETFANYNVLSVRGVYLPKTELSPYNAMALHYYLGDRPFPHFVNLEGNASYDANAFFTVGGWDDQIRFGHGGPELAYRLFQLDADYGKQIYSPLPALYHDYADNDQHLREKQAKQTQSMERLRSKYPDYDNFLANWDAFYRRSEKISPRRESPDSHLVNEIDGRGRIDLGDRKPTVSVVIPTFNRSGFLAEALSSALNQTVPADEIIVVDDESTDNTRQVVKALANNNVRYISKAHSGAPATRNRGIAEAAGDFILWLDDDDILMPDTLESHLSVLKTNPDTDVVYGVLQEFDSRTGADLERFHPNDWSLFPHMVIAKMLQGCPLPNPGTLVRRNVYERYGNYDISFSRAHDYEFWSRTINKIRLKKNYAIVCRYRIHTDNMSAGDFVDRSFESRIMRQMLHHWELRQIYHWLDWDKPAAASAVALYMVSANFVKIGDMHNALNLLNNIPLQLRTADIYDLWLRALLYQGNLKRAKELLNSISANKHLETKQLRSLRTNLQAYTKLSEALETSFKNGDRKAVQSIFHALSSGDHLIPPMQLISFVEQFGDSIPLKQYIKILQTAVMESPQNDLIQKRAFALIRAQEARDALAATCKRILEPIPDSDMHRTKRILHMGDFNNFSTFTSSTTQPADNTTFSVLFKKAVRDYEAENYQSAYDTIAQAIAIQDDSWDAYDLLVNILVETGKEDAIPNELSPLENRVSLTASFWALLGNGYEAAGDFAKSIYFAEQAFKLDKTCSHAWNLLGMIAYREGNVENATHHFKKAINCDDGWGDPWTNLGTLYWEMGNHNKALEYFEQGVRLSPTAPNVASTYHIAISEVGAYDRARPVFEDVVRLHPDFRRARFLLVDILVHLEAFHIALEQIEAIILRFGPDPQLMAAAKEVRRKVGPLVVSEKKHPSLSLCMIVKNEEKHLPRCLDSLKPLVDEMVVVDTGSSDMTRDIAEVFGARVYDFEWQDDFASARNCSLEKANGDWILVMDADEVIAPKDHKQIRDLIKQSKSNGHAYMVVTRNYIQEYNSVGWEPNRGQYPLEEAGSGWIPSEKVRIFPNGNGIRFHYPIHEVVGPSLSKRDIKLKTCPYPIHHYGKLDTTKERQKNQHYYKIGLEKLKSEPNNTVALREMAIQAAKMGKFEDAIEFWNRFSKLKPDSARCYINMAYSLAKLGKYIEAKKAAHTATRLSPNLKEGHLNLGLCELHLGKPTKAEIIFRKIIRKHKSYHSAIYLLGASQLCLGHTQKASQTLKPLRKTNMWPNLHHSFQNLVESLMSAGCTDSARNLIIGTEYLNCSNEKLKAYHRKLQMEAA